MKNGVRLLASNLNAMKLSDRNNAVHFLLDGDPVRYRSVSANETTDFMNREFTHMKPLFRQKIQYVCRSFHEAFFKQGNKLANVIREGSITQSGTFIIPVKEGVNLTVFYNIDSKAENVDRKWILNGCMIAFARKKDIPDPQLFFCHLVKDGYATNYFATDHILEGTAAPTHVQYLVGLILFSNFCEVETKIVPPGKKSLYRNDKYVNETGLPIEILDSTWFTTIVRSEGFSVGGDTGGFFRWQRFGPNLSQKKIIWVTAFEKKGYMRKAKVLMTRQ